MSGLIKHIMRTTDSRDMPPLKRATFIPAPVLDYDDHMARLAALRAADDDDDRRKYDLESGDDV